VNTNIAAYESCENDVFEKGSSIAEPIRRLAASCRKVALVKKRGHSPWSTK
jgi:hypothetical protein